MDIKWDGALFSKELKKKRLIDDDIDMRTLSKNIDVSAATISRCENGDMPDLRSYAKICNYLCFSLDTFISIDAKKKKK